jgi:hypothetical protein
VVKHKKDTDIVLFPQPTNDLVNDPLNWPAWRKTIAFISIGIFTALGGWVLGCVSPGVVLLMDDFHKDLNTTVDGAINWGVLVLGVGVGPKL